MSTPEYRRHLEELKIAIEQKPVTTPNEIFIEVYESIAQRYHQCIDKNIYSRRKSYIFYVGSFAI